MLKNPLAQAVTIIAAALVLAVVANGFASRQRRLVLPGYYPNALRVPPPESSTPPATVTPFTPPAASTSSLAPVAAPSDNAVTTTTATTTSVPAPAHAIKSATTPAAGAAAAPPITRGTAASAPPTAAPAVDPLTRFKPHPDKAYVEIGGDDAAMLHARGVLFLDARRTSVFEDGHIAGARPFSVWESDVDDKVNTLFSERSDQASQDLPIVIYCSGGACEDSHMLAQKLWGVQFNNVYVYKDGFPDWQKRRGAVRTGGQP